MVKFKPEVSICCITYNQEEFIAIALNSFLEQKTTFEYEILVYDDDSTDRTSDILKDFEKREHRIKLIFGSANLGSQGKKVFPEVLKYAQSDYIAICEGDDYWSNTKKLQLQYNLLKKADLSGVFGKTQVLFEENFFDINYGKIIGSDESSIINLNKLSSDQWLFAHTSSFFFRRSVLNNFIKNPGNNNKLFYDIINNGRVGFINKNISVYRKHPEGISIKRGMDKELNCNHYYNNYLFFKDLKERSNVLKPQIRYSFNYAIIALLGCNKKTLTSEKIFAIIYFIFSFNSKKYQKNLKLIKKRISSIIFHGGIW